MIPYTKDTDDYKARRWKEIKRKELWYSFRDDVFLDRSYKNRILRM